MALGACQLEEGAVVGLPRALLFYELYPFWKALFEKLGLRIAVSGPTSRDVIEAGIREAADEACLPVKAFYGHVMALRGKVDTVFLPRLVSLKGGTYTCPKLLGLPDMIRHNVGRLPRVIIAEVDETKPGKGLMAAGLSLARRLGRAPGRARAASAAALEALGVFRAGIWSGRPFEEAAGWLGPRDSGVGSGGEGAAGRDGSHIEPREVARAAEPVRVGLVGHAYNLFDPGVNLDLPRKLARLGCGMVTSEALTEKQVEAESSTRPKEIFWSSGRRVLAAATHFRRGKEVDGIIHVVSFGCGPDSMIGEIAERETRRTSDLPYMLLTIDEHTAEAGLVTRLEAFVDMLERRRARGLGPAGSGREGAAGPAMTAAVDRGENSA